MPRPSLRHRAVWSGALLAFATTFAWFHWLWREPFLRGLGRPVTALSRPHTAYEATIIQFAGCLVSAYVIAWLFKHFDVRRLPEGLSFIVIIWLGLVVAVASPLMMAAGFPLYFLAICSGGVLAQMLTMGAVVSVWRA